MSMNENLPIVAHPKDVDLSTLKEMELTRLKETATGMSNADYGVYVDKINAEIKARHGVADRVCGECTACCTVMAVGALYKASYRRCSHDSGCCAVYASRPKPCRAWCCSWLLGRIEGDERQRPDKLGLMFTLEPLTGKAITVAYEVWPGAGKQSDNEYLLRTMSQQMPVVLRQYETKKCYLFVPDPVLRKEIGRLIQDDWYNTGYTQIVVSNFQPTK
jgi:hypothetical protein